MASDRGMVSGGLTRRALVFAAPSLLVPTVVLAAVVPTPGAAGVVCAGFRLPEWVKLRRSPGVLPTSGAGGKLSVKVPSRQHRCVVPIWVRSNASLADG